SSSGVARKTIPRESAYAFNARKSSYESSSGFSSSNCDVAVAPVRAWYPTSGAVGATTFSVIQVWNLTQSAPASWAASISCSASATSPLWLTPASAMTKQGRPSPIVRPPMSIARLMRLRLSVHGNPARPGGSGAVSKVDGMARDPQVAEATISVHGTIRDAMRAIGRGGLGLALLVDPESERFAGLVTDGDLRRALLGGLGLDAALADVRRPEPKTARLGMTPEEISALFTEPVRVVPVLDDEGRIADVAMFDRRVRLPVAEPLLGEQELLYVAECVLTGWVSSAGSFIERFERAFADFCGTKHAVAVSNGTAALHLALLALGIGSGDEVIVPTLTFIATANAVSYTGASPVMVESEPNTWTIDPDA